MSDKLDEIVKEIAQKHGVTISRDDPIMILHTLNELLLKENSVAQKVLLDTFKREIEGVASQWSQDAKNKAERTLNAALVAGKESIAAAAEENAKAIAFTVKREIEASLTSQLQSAISRTRRLSLINVAAAAMTIFAASIVLWFA